MTDATGPTTPPPGTAGHAALAAAVARAQDREAFAILFDFYAPRIQLSLLRMRVERGLADEIAQDTMLALWRKAHLFDPAKSSLATWLTRIARNRRIDLARRDRVDYRDPFGPALDLADDSRPGAGARMEAEEREAILRAAIADLPEEQVLLVKLAFFEGLTHSQVAAQTGLPLGTVKSRLRLAFSRLRRAVEAAGVETAT